MQTITLHNIRSELRWFGNELWRNGAGRRELVGMVRPIAESGRWEVACPGHMIVSFPDELTARVVVEMAVCDWLQARSDLT